jgi:hypothetical protein
MCAVNTRKSSTGFWLDAIPGLLGLFGVGEWCLGRKLRAELFLIWTAALYLGVLGSFLLLIPTYYTGFLPIAWGTGYVLLLIDITRLTRRKFPWVFEERRP